MFAKIVDRDGSRWLVVETPLKTPTRLSEKGNASVGGGPASVTACVPECGGDVPIQVRMTAYVPGEYVKPDAPIVAMTAASDARQGKRRQ